MINKHRKPQSRRGCILATAAAGVIVILAANIIDSLTASPREVSDWSRALVWLFILGIFYVALNTKYKKDEDWFE